MRVRERLEAPIINCSKAKIVQRPNIDSVKSSRPLMYTEQTRVESCRRQPVHCETLAASLKSICHLARKSEERGVFGLDS